MRADQIAAQPTLALTAASVHVIDGDRDRIEHWLETAERLIAAGQDVPRSADAARAALRAMLARRGTVAMIDDAAAACELAGQDDPWRPLACMVHGAGLHLLGDRARAVRVLEEGARRGSVTAPSAQVLCLAQLALLRAGDEDWDEAALLASRARSQLGRAAIARYPITALVHAASALVRAHRDSLEAAQDDRRKATELLDRLVDPPPWYAVEVRVALARTMLRLGDAVTARALTAEAERDMRHVGDAPLAARWIEECRAQADTFASSVLVGPASLTNAELRVLRLLPTHLSFREMGLYLHVTANTVKTHAHAVYRKLDACSRSEAVVQARGLGLLSASPEPQLLSHGAPPCHARARAPPPGGLGTGRGAGVRRRRSPRARRGVRGSRLAAGRRQAAWLLVGIAALLAAVVALLALVNTIVIPVVTATIIAAVCSPLVRRLAGHVPRAAATVVVFLSLLLTGVGVAVLVLTGITNQARGMQDSLRAGVEELEAGLRDAGVSTGTAQEASSDASATVSDAFHALLDGLATGIGALASLAVFLTFTALSLFFLLKDGPIIRAWTERHMGLPPSVARIVTGRTLGALQGYFVGVTAIAAFNAVVIGIGALVLDLPQVGSIMLVNFFAAYVPYLGAWSAGAFTVLIALGSQGAETRRGDGRDRAARQRGAAADDPADRVRSDARHPPARRADRDDRRRGAVRDDRPDPRCAADLGRAPHLLRPRPCPCDPGARRRGAHTHPDGGAHACLTLSGRTSW